MGHNNDQTTGGCLWINLYEMTRNKNVVHNKKQKYCAKCNASDENDETGCSNMSNITARIAAEGG